MISVKNVIKQYGNLQVLNNVSISIENKEFVSITGPSGAGKSTLLQIIGTLDKPTSGEVLFDHQNLFELNNKKIAAIRNAKIGFVFQFHHLLPEFSVFENIVIPAMIKGTKTKDYEIFASELLSELGINHIKDKKPSQISGGEAQRVAIARALINKPQLLLADEPTGNLDTANSETVFNLLLELRKKYNLTLVMVTHNEQLAQKSDRIIKMKDGKIVD